MEVLTRPLTEADLQALENHFSIADSENSPEYTNHTLYQTGSQSLHTDESILSLDANPNFANNQMPECEDAFGSHRNVYRQTSDQFAQVDKNQISPQEFLKFRRWWEECLQMLKNVAYLWNYQNPVIIAGFYMTAERTNQLL